MESAGTVPDERKVGAHFGDPGVAVRLLALVLAGGGLIGGITNFFLANDFWPWDMPPTH